MIQSIAIFYIIMIAYHIISVVLLGTIGYEHIEKLTLIRDWGWVMIASWSLLYHYKNILPFIKQRKKTIIRAGITIVFAILISIIQQTSIYNIAIGIKYGFMFLWIAFSAIWIGYNTSTQQIQKIKKRLPYTLVTVIIIWLLRQMVKYMWPDLFFQIGYGAIGDFVFGQEPPIYYRTGPWWEPRLQWLFAWPNNYGYFLAAFFPLILNQYKQYKKYNHRLWWTIVILLTILSIILTLSRTAIIGTILWSSLLYRGYIKQNKKLLYTIIISTIIVIAGLSILKWWSTQEHITQKTTSISYIIQQPQWYGLWSSWPAIHHDGEILPENYYMQIAIDIGTIGFILLMITLISIKSITQKLIANNQGPETTNQELVAISTWFYILLIMWLFLHVFEDSMVNYLFFIPFGLYLWYYSKLNYKQYQTQK